MKTLLALLCLVWATSEHTGVEIPVEMPEDTPQGQLVRLQLEEVALALRYREANPHLAELRRKIADLLARPDIRDEIYYAVLGGQLAVLREDRASLITRFREQNPRVFAIDRQIAFAEKTLADRLPTRSAEK